MIHAVQKAVALLILGGSPYPAASSGNEPPITLIWQAPNPDCPSSHFVAAEYRRLVARAEAQSLSPIRAIVSLAPASQKRWTLRLLTVSPFESERTLDGPSCLALARAAAVLLALVGAPTAVEAKEVKAALGGLRESNAPMWEGPRANAPREVPLPRSAAPAAAVADTMAAPASPVIAPADAVPQAAGMAEPAAVVNAQSRESAADPPAAVFTPSFAAAARGGHDVLPGLATGLTATVELHGSSVSFRIAGTWWAPRHQQIGEEGQSAELSAWILSLSACGRRGVLHDRLSLAFCLGPEAVRLTGRSRGIALPQTDVVWIPRLSGLVGIAWRLRPSVHAFVDGHLARASTVTEVFIENLGLLHGTTTWAGGLSGGLRFGGL